MTIYLYRKYVDLIREASNNYANWDPHHEVIVGSYGSIDPESTVLNVKGNVYDPEFKRELDLDNVQIDLADSDFQPQLGPIENDIIITTRGAKRKDWDASKEAEVPGLANALIKGKWVFERRDRRDAILIMHKPRRVSFLPDKVLGHLFLVDELIEKALVTSKYVCSAYSMYLSEKSPDRTSNAVSIALMPTASGLAWWIDSSAGVFRNGIDETGNQTFTPLSVMQRPIKRIRRTFVGKIEPEPEGDELWYYESPPWEPLDEDGEEDPLEPEVFGVDPFEHVYEEARKRGDPRLPRSERRPPKPSTDDELE